MSYNSKSKKAEEFICHEEIEETLRYAEEHKNDVEDMRKILERAKDCKGLSIRKFSDWRRKSRKNFMATGSCCSRRCIFQTTASMAVNTARIMDRTSISAERS